MPLLLYAQVKSTGNPQFKCGQYKDEKNLCPCQDVIPAVI